MPPRLFIGVSTQVTNVAGAWKIDIGQANRDRFETVRRFADSVAGRLDAASCEAILAIKEQCWTHPEYRRSFTSADVYSARLGSRRA